MKLGIALLTVSLLTGCASNGWQDYKEAHACVGTAELMQKNEIIQGQSTATGLMPSPTAPTIRIKTYRKFDCSNGSIWGPA